VSRSGDLYPETARPRSRWRTENLQRPYRNVTYSGDAAINKTHGYQGIQLTTWNRIIPKQLTVTQLINKFPTSYWTQMSIAVIRRASHKTLSWATCIQSACSSYFFKLYFNISLPITSSSYWLLLRGGIIQSVPCTATIFWSIVLPIRVLIIPDPSISAVWQIPAVTQ
jgi:hypothetical protein